MTGFLIKKGNVDTDRHARREDWSDTVTAKEEKGLEQILPVSSLCLCRHLDLGPLASRTVRQ